MAKRIYIAEADAAEASQLREFLSLFRLEIMDVKDLAEAGQQLTPSDVLLVDLYFRPSGMLQELARLRPKASLIFLTTPRTLFDEEEDLARQLGLNLLRKPIDYEVLYGRLVDQMEIQS